MCSMSKIWLETKTFVDLVNLFLAINFWTKRFSDLRCNETFFWRSVFGVDRLLHVMKQEKFFIHVSVYNMLYKVVILTYFELK